MTFQVKIMFGLGFMSFLAAILNLVHSVVIFNMTD